MVKEWKKPVVKWVVLDESDIIATSNEDVHLDADVQGEGVQKGIGTQWDTL